MCFVPKPSLEQRLDVSVACCARRMRISDSETSGLYSRPAHFAHRGGRDLGSCGGSASQCGFRGRTCFRGPGGEGAFYGPKLEFHLKDSRGRNWQCGTVQVDFVLPQRLDASFVNDRGQQETPIMIHHAILGSMERFIGILLEHYDGWLPVWLAPEQVVVATVTSSDLAYALEVVSALEGAGIRVALDDRAERLGKKIVDAREKCISLMAVVGARDALKRTISLRRRNGVQETAPLGNVLGSLQRECAFP